MQKASLLLIDDDVSVNDIVRHYLKKNDRFNFELDWVENSEQATQQIDKCRYDLIIFDYNLNQDSGIELYERLVPKFTDQKTSLHTPAILMTNNKSLDVALESVHTGFSDFICKSELSATTFNHAINNVLERHLIKLQLEQHRIEIEEMNSILQQQNNEIKNFYHVVSHELKTPLTAIKEFVSLITDGVTGAIEQKTKECLHLIDKNCIQLRLYLNDLLEATRISVHKFRI